jgi:Leucine-rich repeat (LRR) protein
MFGSFKKKVETDGTRKFEELKKILSNEDVLAVVMSGTNQCPFHLTDKVRQAVSLTRYLSTLTELSPEQIMAAALDNRYHKEIVSIIIAKEKNGGSDISDNHEWTKDLIDWADKSKINQYKVGDSSCPGTGFPREKSKIINLDFLHLSNSNINYLSPKLGKMKFLTQIYLDNNNIKEYPKEMCYFSNLFRLDIDENELTTLPKEIPDSVRCLPAFRFSRPKWRKWRARMSLS